MRRVTVGSLFSSFTKSSLTWFFTLIAEKMNLLFHRKQANHTSLTQTDVLKGSGTKYLWSQHTGATTTAGKTKYMVAPVVCVDFLLLVPRASMAALGPPPWSTTSLRARAVWSWWELTGLIQINLKSTVVTLHGFLLI